MFSQEEFLSVRAYIHQFCNRYNYPQEAIDCFLQNFDKIAQCEELKNLFFTPVYQYSIGKKVNISSLFDNGNRTSISKTVANALSVSAYTTDFLLCLCLIPFLEKRYEVAGVDKQVFYDGMLDFWCKLWECKRVYNVWGSFVANWFVGWFKMTRFAFGRLQFEPLPTGFACFLLLKNEKGKRKLSFPMQRYLNIHIPSMGPLDHGAVIDSYKQAYAFFRKRGYGKTILYHTTSWLLSPDHKKMFAPDSNIVRFLSDFHLFEWHIEPDNNDFWRIYNRPFNKEHPDCSGETTMHKKYAEIILKGGHIKHGAGAFFYDGTSFYK